MTSAAMAGFGTSGEHEYTNLPVSGELPAWLSGTLLRNGPGTFQVGTQRYRHWFDGLAMLHRFTIHDGTVSYANRYLESRAHIEAMSSGQIAYSEFATDPCRSLFARVMAVFEPTITDSAKVNITELAGRYLALAETPIQVEFDPRTLRSVGVARWDSSDFGRMTTVHPHTDSERGEAFNLVTRYSIISRYCLRRVATHDATLNGTDVATHIVARPGYIHSFGMSHNHLVIAEFPLTVNPGALLLWLRPYIENFRWRPRRGTRFHVFDRRTGRRIRTLRTDARFAFHHVNAYDDGDDLVCDMVAYDDHSVIGSFYLHRLEDPDSRIPAGTLRRYRLSLTRGTVSEQVLCPEPIELPSFDYAQWNTDPGLRFVYGVGLSGDLGFYDRVVKIDTATGASLTWAQPACFPGEPVFVATPGGTEQDDGVLLSVVLDSARGTSFLVVLSAATLAEVARVELPHAVLHGYHGRFTPA